MTMKNNYQGLGRGLETLLQVKQVDINQPTQGPLTGFQKLPVFSLKSGRFQPRKHFDEDALVALADSIKSQGLVQPIIVQEVQNGSQSSYEIIAGERRWRAAQLAGLSEVPVVIRDDVSDQQAMTVALIENIQREDLNVIEEAEGLKRLHEEFNMTHEQIAEVVGCSRASVTNTMRLLDLDQKVQRLVREDKLKMGHVRALLSLDEEDQLNLAQRAVTQNMSVRQVERLVQNVLSREPEVSKTVNPELQAQLDELCLLLKKSLRSEVKISAKSNGSGNVQVPFNNVSELQSLATAWAQALNPTK